MADGAQRVANAAGPSTTSSAPDAISASGASRKKLAGMASGGA